MFESGGDDSTQTSVWSGVNRSASISESSNSNLTSEVVVNSEDSENWPSISGNMNANRTTASHTQGTVVSGASGSDISPSVPESTSSGNFPTGVSSSSVTPASLAYSISSPMDSTQRSSWSNSLGNSGSSWNTLGNTGAGGDTALWGSATDTPASREGLWSNIGSATGANAWSTEMGGSGTPSTGSAALWGDRGLSLPANGHSQHQSVSQVPTATSPSTEWSGQAVSRSNSLPWGGTSPPASVWSDPSAFDSSSVADSQTWAQAVGKSLPINAAGDTSNNGSVAKTPEPVPDERDRMILQVINSNDGWGRNAVDQSNPWDLSELRSNRVKQQVESNVWPNEPPNGTGIWDAYYNTSSEKSNRWQPQSSTSWSAETSGSGSAWPNEPHGANEWDSATSGASRGARGIGAGGSGGGGGGGGGGPYWNDKPMLQSSVSWDPQESMPGKRNLWMDDRGSGAPSIGGGSGNMGGGGCAGGSVWNEANWMGGGRRGQENENWGGQWDKTHENQTFWNQAQRTSASGGAGWNENHWSGSSMENVAKWTSSSDPDYGGRRGSQQQAPYGRINSRPEQQMRVHAMKQLMHMGFKKEDAQHALITHNMDVDRAIADLLNSRDRELVAQQNSVTGLMHGDPGSLPPNANNMASAGQQGDYGFGGPRSRHHVAGNNNNQMGSGPMSMSSSGQTHPHQQQQQQQLMRQHIAQQLRMAVQNRLINPNMLNANLTNRELVPFQQLLQYQNSVNIQRQRLSQVQQQMQMASSSNNPVLLSQLRQQHDMLMQNINAAQAQIKLLSQNLNTLRSGGNASGGTQPTAVTPQGGRGGGVEASELSSRLAELRFANNQQQPSQQQSQQQSQMMHQTHWNRGGPMGHGVDVDGHVGNAKLHPVQSSPNLQQSMGLPMQANNAYTRAMSMQPSVSDPAFAGVNDWGPDAESMGANTGLDSAVAAAVDIPEFVPGQPWQGISNNNSTEDPNMTLGSVRPGLLSLNNDHLERLSTNNDGTKTGNRSTPSGTSIGGRSWAPDKSAFSPVTGGSQQMQPSNYLLVRNMFPSVSVDVVKAFCQTHGQLASLQPNLHAGWVLVRFMNRDEAVRAQRFLNNRLGTVEFVSEGDANRYMAEIQALATRFATTAGNHANTPSSGAATTPQALHSQHLQHQQQQQSRQQQSQQLASTDTANGDMGQSTQQMHQQPDTAGGNGPSDSA